MKIKTLVATAILMIGPAMATAQCMNGMAPDDRQAMSCVPGTAWDAKTGLCVPVASS